MIDWSALTVPDNGGTAIFSYNLVWDNGSGSTNIDLVGSATNFTSTTHTISAGIVAGTTYRFKYRALNKYGWGPYSDEV